MDQDHSLAPMHRAESNGKQSLLTIFSVLKPFAGESDSHQRNALASWRALGPDVEIILFSDTTIPADIRAQFTCHQTTAVNEFGTPLLDEVFRVAAAEGHGTIRAFINADIIVDWRFVEAVRLLRQERLPSWLAVGQRTEFDVPNNIDHDCPDWIADCFQQVDSHGKQASITCKDYFIFTADLFREIPGFAIGRGNWDNWMIWQCKHSGIPVVDISRIAPVIHQKHGYAHVPGGRLSVYVSGPEARANQRLAGGRKLVTGSTPNWKMDERGLHKIRLATLGFGRDLWRFASLVVSMITSRDSTRGVVTTRRVGDHSTRV